MSAVEERENEIKYFEKIRAEAKSNLRKIKGKNDEEESEDEI